MAGVNSPYHEQLASRRAQTLAQIYDVAEAIMSSGAELTAGAVADAVGIKRNSLYRYIDSIDDLRARVVGRHFPAWITAVREVVDEARAGASDTEQAEASSVAERTGAGMTGTAAAGTAERGARATVAFVEANLRQATRSGHGWLMQLGAGIRRSQLEGESGGHAVLDDMLAELVAEALPQVEAERRAIVAALIRGLISTGFTLIDAGGSEDVIEEATQATRAILARAYGSMVRTIDPFASTSR
ncbi:MULTISPECIES: hypothetical protein [Trueperella]|uniref:hypothetical protein n=1 Tax=Trueperella TaxID=1069494 RepID=UPI0008A4C09B|nr:MULTISPECIES: hypothetical protein [Trueperella]MCM3907486.1 hypothetical protein [Trueperella bernardiae]OFS65490.1 hypothetical protein HMPREF3174_07840 [Trueperella sp. HMSC08H06]